MMGGNHATAPRSRIAEHVPFIRQQAAKGYPASAIARMIGRPSSDVEAVLSPMRPKPKPAPAPVRHFPVIMPKDSVGAIARQVAEEHGLTLVELTGPSRKRRFVYARHDAFARTYQVRYSDGSHRHSLMQIARFYRVDHTTVLHGIRAHWERNPPAEVVA